MMQISSYFIKDKCLFGSYPNKEQVEELEKIGVKYFIDLTTRWEKLDRYKCNVNYISYPIRDNNIPNNIDDFLKFLEYLKLIYESLDKKEKMYIHCKGGHGRAGLVVCCLLCMIENIDSKSSIDKTTEYHKIRPNIKEKWQKEVCPNNVKQQEFLKSLFK